MRPNPGGPREQARLASCVAHLEAQVLALLSRCASLEARVACLEAERGRMVPLPLPAPLQPGGPWELPPFRRVEITCKSEP